MSDKRLHKIRPTSSLATIRSRSSATNALTNDGSPQGFLSRKESLNRSLNTTSSPRLPENDDDAEKRDRLQQKVVMLQSMTSINEDQPASNLSESTASIKGFTPTQLADHYTNCIKLSSENKITVKNAFALHLIDYMTEMLRKKDSDMNNFQVASCTLDASAKIYAYRVDCVHSEAFKIAGGLGRSKKDGKKENSVDQEQRDLSDQENNNEDDLVKKKRKRVRKGVTIEQNLKNINFTKVEMEYEVDPIYHKMTEFFSEGSASGYFVTALTCQDDNCHFLLDSDALMEYSVRPTPDEARNTIDISEFCSQWGEDSFKNKEICPQFISFEFNNVNIESLNDADKASNMLDPNDMEINANYDSNDDSDHNDNIDNDMGFANDDDHGSTWGGETNEASTTAHQSTSVQSTSSSRTQNTELINNLSSQPSEYSYFRGDFMSAWAGPSHWRVKPASKDKSSTNTSEVYKAKKTFKKPPSLLDYSLIISYENFFQKMKAQKLGQKTIQSWNKEKTTLPLDQHYDPTNLCQLFLKPAYSLGIQKELDNLSGNDIGNYNYNNNNDMENFCPQIDNNCSDNDSDMGPLPDGINHDDDDDDHDAGFGDSATQNLSDGMFFGDNLVKQPNKVAKVDIGYAKVAKKVDVKKIKSSLWNILTTPDTLATPNASKSSEEETVSETTFSTLLQTLPAKISTQQADNLSIPIAFVCLLHLVNEKNLHLESLGEFQDLKIIQG